MSDTYGRPHLSEAELAALIYAPGQDRDAERRAYSHLATCDACTRLVGSLRDSDRDTNRLLSSLDVAPPTVTAESIMRAAQARQRSVGFAGRRAAAVVGFLLVAAAAAAAAYPASPIHRWLAAVLASRERAGVLVNESRKAPTGEPASPAVSFVSAPGATLDIEFSGSGAGGALDVRVVDGDQVSLSSPTAGATYRVSSNHITVDQSAPANFTLEIPRLLRELRVRVGGDVVFDQRAPIGGTTNAFTIQLTRPNGSRQ